MGLGGGSGDFGDSVGLGPSELRREVEIHRNFLLSFPDGLSPSLPETRFSPQQEAPAKATVKDEKKWRQIVFYQIS